MIVKPSLAVAASAIVIGEEREIEREEATILVAIDELNDRLDRIDAALLARAAEDTSPQPHSNYRAASADIGEESTEC